MVYRDRWEYHQLSFGSRHFGESIDSGSPGRLSQSTEAGAGKRQIFAIGNFVNQRWSLFMISSWTRFGLSQWMELFISSDRSLDRWKGFSKVYSFDLKSATDRWPLSLQTNLIRTFFGKSFGDCLDAIFSRSIFEVPFLRSVRGVVFFRVGQPLGFLSSWPLFTLTHHLVMFYCAEKVYPGQRLTRYAILGDDVCIADENVASLYRQTVNDLGLAIRKGVR